MDNLDPIKDAHIAFSHALVALAREHGASSLEVKYSLTGSAKKWDDPKPTWDPTRVTFNWSEGRHGDPSRFLLRAEANMSIEESMVPKSRRYLTTPTT